MFIKRAARSVIIFTLIAAFVSTAGFAQTRKHDLSLLGFRIGRNVGLFGELGAGYKGIFCGGLNAQF